MKSPTDIVHSVMDPQIERLFRKMDKLEDDHGHWASMPIEHFRQHGYLGRTAAHLGIARDRILHHIKKEGSEAGPLCQRCPGRTISAAGVFRILRMDSAQGVYEELCEPCADIHRQRGAAVEAVIVRR